MRIGFALPQFGDLAGPDTIRAVAQHVEEIGADSLWVGERLLYPVAPEVPYPGSADGSMPRSWQRGLKPLDILTFASAHTRRVTLGTSVLVMHLYHPLHLAQSLASIDVLSGGRVRVGLGNGWMPEELRAMGVPMNALGRRADEYIDVMKKIWIEDPVAHDGEYVHIPESIIALEPVQKPHPPLYLAAYSQSTMRRVARRADGWNPAGVPPERMREAMTGIKQMAASFGRDPERIELVVRANVRFSAAPLGPGRPVFAGTSDEIREHIMATRDIGANELFFDGIVNQSRTLPDILARIDELYELATR